MQSLLCMGTKVSGWPRMIWRRPRRRHVHAHGRVLSDGALHKCAGERKRDATKRNEENP